MNIPSTINAYAISLANLGHHVYLSDETGQVTDNLPIDGMSAFIAANEEHDSVEATFLIPGVVSDEVTALAFSSALQQVLTGFGRFIIDKDHVQAKASLFAGQSLTAAQLQSWWRRSLEEVSQWYLQARHRSILADGTTGPIPQHLEPRAEVFDIHSGQPAPDDQYSAAVTAERVANCMAQITGAMPEVRTTGGIQVVEASIGGQALDIQVANSELCFTIGSSLNNYDPALSTALAQTINQLHVLEPAPAAFVLDSGDHIELYTRAVVDTSVGLDDQALNTAIQKWGPYVYDFNERIFTQLRGQ